jgi:hypothetical protein
MIFDHICAPNAGKATVNINSQNQPNSRRGTVSDQA